MRVARRFLIGGRVQGVGFRFYAEHAAARECIQGWVRNLADGSVEVAAEGDAESMTRFEQAIRQGPRGARVDRFDVHDDVPGGSHGFSIR
jgi:acylphosphatase